MRSLIVAGPGRAGGSLMLAARQTGIDVVGVLARRPDSIPNGFQHLSWDEDLPAADLLVIAVRDGAIREVADHIAPRVAAVPAAVHVSGSMPVGVLDAIGRTGCQIGSFHPLQTLPDRESGAGALRGSWVAVTAGEPLHTGLVELAGLFGMRPFDLADTDRGAYHAAASAASNFVVESLAVAAELANAVGVPFESMRPLAEQVVRNAFELGPEAALTGPVARGDWDTVSAQIKAAADVSDALGEQFRLLTQSIIHRRYGLSSDD